MFCLYKANDNWLLFFSPVNIKMEGTDQRPVHYLGHWFQQKEALLHLRNNMIRKFGSLIVHHSLIL